MPDDIVQIFIDFPGTTRRLPRWFEKHANAHADHLRWCTFDGDAWHGDYPCSCHESYMEDFPDMPSVIAAWILGGRAAVHVIERELLACRGR